MSVPKWRDENREHYLKWRRKHTEKNRDRINAYMRAWRAKNRERYNAERRVYGKKWRAANREKYREYSRASQRLWKYGVTRAQYEQMFEAQRGCCAICGKEMIIQSVERKIAYAQRPRVDHDHRTKQVRALLCINCNIMLG